MGDMGTVLSIVGGGLITIIITIYLERQRKPKLRLSVEQPPRDVSYPQGSPARDARYLRLKLCNLPLPCWARWMQRSAALQCRG